MSTPTLGAQLAALLQIPSDDLMAFTLIVSSAREAVVIAKYRVTPLAVADGRAQTFHRTFDLKERGDAN